MTYPSVVEWKMVMTSYAEKRCIHCGVVYNCLRSGHGFPEYGNHSNAEYCLDCYKVIKEALKSVPVKFESKTVDVSEVPELSGITWETVLDWEKQNEAIPKDESKVYVRRVLMPLFDLEDPDNRHSSREVFKPDGVELPFPFQNQKVGFYLETWTKKPEWNSVRVPVEYDIDNKKIIGPWKYYKR